MHALIMAGGNGKRMGTLCEKSLVLLGGTPLVTHVATAIREVEDIQRIVVACSQNAPATYRHVASMDNRVELCSTPGAGYHPDMKDAMRTAGLSGPVLVIAADVPLISAGTIRTAITAYTESGAQSLCVLLPASSCISRSTPPFDVGGVRMVAVGVNIIDADAIDAPSLTQCNLVIDRPDELLNINTPADLACALILYASRKR